METIKMKPTKIMEGDNGKLYRKLQASDAAKAENPVKGQTGDGDKKKFAFYEEVPAEEVKS